MQVLDITLPLSQGKTSYPSLKVFAVEWLRKLQDGKNVSLSEICFSPHIGTHIDLPSHVFEDGATTDTIALEKLIGEALVIDACQENGAISVNFLSSKIKEHPLAKIILLKTGFISPLESGGSFNQNYAFLSDEAVDFLLVKGIHVLGVDTPNVDCYNYQPMPNHKKLLGHNVLVVEGLKLHEITPGIYMFVGLPMHICGLEAVPLRAVLLDNELHGLS